MSEITVVYPMDGTAPQCVVDGRVYPMHALPGGGWQTDEPVIDGLPIVDGVPLPPPPRFEYMPFGRGLASSYRRPRR